MTPNLEEVTGFLYDEAHMLDSGQFKEWHALFTDDGYYWMPVSPDDTDRTQGAALYNADKAFFEISINRLYASTAHSILPARRACRLVGNIRIAGHEDDATIVRSKLQMHEYRVREIGNDDARVFAGTMHHALVHTTNGLRMRWKRVDIINSEASLTAMPLPL